MKLLMQKKKKISISLGAVYSNEIKTAKEMFECADKVLYFVKEAGKNQHRLLEYQEVG